MIFYELKEKTEKTKAVIHHHGFCLHDKTSTGF